MLERLADIERRYEELSDLINDPEIIADNERWRKLMKEHSDITPIVEKYREYKKIKEELAEAEFFIDDATQNLGKWHKAFKRKNQPMHLELRMRKRKLYSKTCSTKSRN